MYRISMNVLTGEYSKVPLTEAEISDAQERFALWSAIESERAVLEHAEAIKVAAKAQAIIDNLPSRAQVRTEINNIANLADAKEFLLKLTDVVYWLAKDKLD